MLKKNNSNLHREKYDDIKRQCSQSSNSYHIVGLLTPVHRPTICP